MRLWPLEERRGRPREIVQLLPDAVRFSETFNVPLPELMRAVRKHQLEGIVAKRWQPIRLRRTLRRLVKWRANRGQEFVIGSYIPNGNIADSILVGYYKGRVLTYAGTIRAGISTEFQRVLLPHFEELRIPRCPFSNLPDRTEGHWGEGLTAAKMALCRWLNPFIVARIEFLEWPPRESIKSSVLRGNRQREGPR